MIMTLMRKKSHEKFSFMRGFSFFPTPHSFYHDTYIINYIEISFIIQFLIMYTYVPGYVYFTHRFPLGGWEWKYKQSIHKKMKRIFIEKNNNHKYLQYQKPKRLVVNTIQTRAMEIRFAIHSIFLSSFFSCFLIFVLILI